MSKNIVHISSPVGGSGVSTICEYLNTPASQGSHLALDYGVRTVRPDRNTLWLVVVRGPSYRALKALVESETPEVRSETVPDGIILVTEPYRSLTRSDVEAISNAPVVAEIPHDPSIARADDAGLLGAREQRQFAELVNYLNRTRDGTCIQGDKCPLCKQEREEELWKK